MKGLDTHAVTTVAVGGALGAVSRSVLVSAAGAHGPAATLAINVVGAFLLGLLLERLAHSRLSGARRRQLRLLLGTGVLGGFTTYSGIAVEILSRLEAAHWLGALGYGLVTALTGVGACAAGVLLGGRGRRWADQ